MGYLHLGVSGGNGSRKLSRADERPARAKGPDIAEGIPRASILQRRHPVWWLSGGV